MDSQKVLEQTIGIPFSEGNSVSVLKNGDRIFPAMLGAIKEATSSIDFLTFVYWKGDIATEFAKALSKKAQNGVTVRVLLDAYGALPMEQKLVDMMSESGVNVIWFRPLIRWKIWKTDNRTHRKILICDDKVAFTGGVGIAEEWEGDARNPSEWRDTHFKITGPAVSGIKSAFIENWIEANDNLNLEVVGEDQSEEKGATLIQTVRTSSSVRWSDIVLLYQSLIKLAKKRIWICTAYFNPDRAMIDLLTSASESGIDVRILIPGNHTDQPVTKVIAEDSFEELLGAGVQVFYYTKTMLHAKIILVDDELSCVGSGNFNQRSMLKDDEINLVLIDEKINKELSGHYEEDLSNSEKVLPRRWKKRSIFRRATEGFMRIFKQEL
ncbi:MAG: cardiolipin synthase B [Balneolaceae bacterium]|nr:cardiolipin synthase B [Balneolaceae bacterium]MBO6545865.1 cardiolipin synthase B [Balneolaceae bacterium]MBO6647261.1 cardiolipin synthase B [Balneolaceae bacterium]